MRSSSSSRVCKVGFIIEGLCTDGVIFLLEVKFTFFILSFGTIIFPLSYGGKCLNKDVEFF